MKMHRKECIKIIIFVFIFLVIFTNVSKVLVNSDENSGHRLYHLIQGFYKEPEDSLDAVYIGSSVVYTYWEAPVAWEKSGIKVWPYATGGQSIVLAKSIIENIRKTQPEALYIININMSYNMNIENAHWLADNLPRTLPNMQLMADICKVSHFSFKESLEIFFPILQFHSRWSRLKEEDFNYHLDNLKGGYHWQSFLQDVNDNSANCLKTEKRAQLDPYVVKSISDLLDYCEMNKLNVLFITSPWCAESQMTERINSIKEIIIDRGFPILDLFDYTDEIGMDPATDYYDDNHANIHGSLKVTDFLTNYLVDNYDFADKRSDPACADWNEAYDRFKEIIVPYLSEEELSRLP